MKLHVQALTASGRVRPSSSSPVIFFRVSSRNICFLSFKQTASSSLEFLLYLRANFLHRLGLNRKSKRITMSENKHHKRHDQIEHTDDMKDHISNLSDCILHHILSFLPTVKVVQTSILSKRWKNLWASVHSLDLDEDLWNAVNEGFQPPPELMASFENFEERILRSPDAPKIQKIRLDCRYFFDPSRISSWISKEVMCNVRELQLCLYANDPCAFAQTIFDCKSLVILKIEMINFVIPSRIYLPCLKTLDLTWVTFPDEESTEKLFSSCPVLEELVLWSCDYENLKNITISSLTLKKLTIDDHRTYWPIHTYPVGCKIKIDAKNLKYLYYDGYLTNEILLNNVPSLVKACINIPVVDGRQDVIAYNAIDLLKGIQNVVFLTVSNCTLESIQCAEIGMNLFPVFPNLTHLVLTTAIGNHTFETFMDLLNFCPTLQSVSLYEGFDNCMLLLENDSILVPKCISYHLKTLSFKNFYAYDSEICFLKFILKYACSLEKMDIWWSKPEPPDVKKQRDVSKEFETTEKSSASCIINFL